MHRRSNSQQEAYIAEKKYHLNVLDDVADCINSSTGLDDLLHRFLLTLQGGSECYNGGCSFIG